MAETSLRRSRSSWHFRLNGFVLEGLREHGLLPTIWSLGGIAEHANASFFYINSHELFFTRESARKGKPEAELDLLIVSDRAGTPTGSQGFRARNQDC